MVASHYAFLRHTLLRLSTRYLLYNIMGIAINVHEQRHKKYSNTVLYLKYCLLIIIAGSVISFFVCVFNYISVYYVLCISATDHKQEYTKQFVSTARYQHGCLIRGLWLIYGILWWTIFNILKHVCITWMQSVTGLPQEEDILPLKDEYVWKCDLSIFNSID